MLFSAAWALCGLTTSRLAVEKARRNIAYKQPVRQPALFLAPRRADAADWTRLPIPARFLGPRPVDDPAARPFRTRRESRP